jgi:hypothetical protein
VLRFEGEHLVALFDEHGYRTLSVPAIVRADLISEAS